MASTENPHSGQGAVVLDIGGEIGALIVEMPAEMADLEVEIIPTGTDARPDVGHHHPNHRHQAGDGHAEHTHDASGSHSHPSGLPPHVAVVARPAPDGSTIHSLVYGELQQGTYDLYVRPDGPVRLTATVNGGAVTETRWPD